MEIRIRSSVKSDAKAIATLHTMSWLSTYRGLLSDEYLDNDLQGERELYWNKKLADLTALEFVLVMESGKELLGFVSLLDIPEQGFDAFINNLHVRPDLKGKGLGTKLLSGVARKLLQSGRKSFYLWVLKGNSAAEKFYLARGAKKLDKSRSLFGGFIADETRFGWDEEALRYLIDQAGLETSSAE